MSRIPDEVIKRLKSEVSLVRLCERYGIELKPQGKNLVGFCPWHKDDKASFIVTPEKNLWHCMGACDEGGDVFNLVMKAEEVSFRQAAEILLELSGSVPAFQTIKTPSGDTHPILVHPDDDLTDSDLMDHVTQFYHRAFLNDPKAMKYLEKRHCMHPEAVKAFRIGYANRTLCYRVPGATTGGRRLKERLQALGIMRESGHEHLSGSVVFPIFDSSGRVVQMYGRKITPNLRKGTPEHLYLEQPMAGVWNLEGIAHAREWVLCECIIDGLSLWYQGLRNVTCCFGKNTFTDDLWEVLRKVRPNKITIAFDNDASGNQAAEKLSPRLSAEGANVCRVKVPQGKDINEYVDLLSRRDPKAIPGILQGLFLDASVTHRADPGMFEVPRPKPAPQAAPNPTDSSFLAASLAANLAATPAAKEEGGREKGREPGLDDARSDDGASLESSAAKGENTSSFSHASGPAHAALSLAAVDDLAAKGKSEPLESGGDGCLPECGGVRKEEAASPDSGAPDVTVTRKGDDTEIRIGDRSYRIRGLAKNQALDVMKVNVRVISGGAFHVDTLDLYNARHRTAFINTAAAELSKTPEVMKKDLGRVLLKLEELQDLEIKEKAGSPEPKEPEMTEKEREEALRILKSPNLLDHVLKGFEAQGLVGERINKLAGYLSAVSRKLDRPLAVVIQSSSASGKSTLMQAILDMMPEEERVQYSAMTGQSLFYFGDKSLKHKILAIVEEEGVRQASYALKLLQSEGKLTIACTSKDAVTGQMVTRDYHVEGPVMIITTTTAIEIEEELLNRCLILAVDESREQTRAIHRAQRLAETLEGLLRKLDGKDVLKTLKNAQRLLRPLHVINPFASYLTFLDDNTRTRRDHKKYLTLIRSSAYLHQYQRPIMPVVHDGVVIECIKATLEDAALANELSDDVLGRTLDDLPPQSRRFLDLVFDMVSKACEERGIEKCDLRFTQRDIRESCGWSDFQVKSHLAKLVSLEYVIVHTGNRGRQFVYELLYNGEGKDGQKFLMGLIDVDALREKYRYDSDREHENEWWEISGSIQGAPREYPGSMEETVICAVETMT